MAQRHIDEAKKAEAELKKSRDEMAKSNAAHMAETAKHVPTPTPAEMKKVMGLVNVEEPTPAPSAPAPAPAPDAHVEEKTSEPKPGGNKGGYSTRAMKPDEHQQGQAVEQKK